MGHYQQGLSGLPRRPRDGSGQMIPILALMIFVLSGMVALAVDIGHVYQQRQQLQNTAVSAAEAGAYETYGFAVAGTTFGSAQDRQTAKVMANLIGSVGYTLMNMSSGGVYSSPPADPCAAGYSSSQVYLQAEYLDAQNNPIPNSTNPALVGNGVPPATPHGVKVLSLGGCVPGFFSPILGRKNFIAGGNAQAGLVYSNATNTGGPCGVTACPSTLTNTATATATATATNTAIPTATSAVPTNTPTADTTTSYGNTPALAPFMIYGQPPTMLYSKNAPDNLAGDLVTIFSNAGDWASNQYPNQAAGLSGTPTGVSVHDSSMDGCLDPSQTNFVIGGSASANFNHGGKGHCDNPTFNVGDTVTIPLVTEVHKNDGSCSSNGGYCEVIEGFIQVKITCIAFPGGNTNGGTCVNSNHAIQGVVVGVVYDPYGIVELPPSPTPTSTPIPPTATKTSVPVPATNTPVPVTATPTPIPPA